MQKQAIRNRRGRNSIQTSTSSTASVKNDRRGVKPVRQVLHVPADPGGQRAILVVVVHRGEVAPGEVAARHFHHARFEIDAEPFPLQQEKARARGGMRAAEARAESRRREKERDESGFEQHSVRLVAGKILRRADERKKADEADRERARAARHSNTTSSDAIRPDPADQHERAIARAEPEERRREPESLPMKRGRNRLQIIASGKNSVGADESLDLKEQRIKRGKINQTRAREEKSSAARDGPGVLRSRLRAEQPVTPLA